MTGIPRIGGPQLSVPMRITEFVGQQHPDLQTDEKITQRQSHNLPHEVEEELMVWWFIKRFCIMYSGSSSGCYMKELKLLYYTMVVMMPFGSLGSTRLSPRKRRRYVTTSLNQFYLC